MATDVDSRTTPGWLQVPGLLLVLVLVAYHAVAARYATASYSDWPAWHRAHPYALWPATWKMFTTRDRTHRDIEAQAYIDGDWVQVDLLTMFPARWESGPRYIRKPFFREEAYRNTLTQAICRRMQPQPEVVRVTMVEWRKTLGQTAQPREDGVKTTLLNHWDCQQVQALPSGRRL